jgi:hypothetical protein
MTFLLALVPARYRVLAEILIIAAIAAAVWGWIEHGKSVARDEGRAEVQQKWDAAVSNQRAEAVADAEANAKETQRRLERQGDAQREQQAELARYQRAAADAVAARDGMQHDIDNLTAAARRGASDTATAGERKAGGLAAGMLAELSRGSDALAELYARAADASRRAGVLCERSYDALTPLGASP